jgi:hypothetical protein
MQMTSPPRGTSPGYFPRALCTAGDFETDDCASRGEAAEEFDRHLADLEDWDEDHFPWHYLEGGVLCSCGEPIIRSDDRCKAWTRLHPASA